MSSLAQRFVVCEDRDDADETKIHTDLCHQYVKRDRHATTMKWHGPVATLGEAESIAQRVAAGKRHSWRRARCCE